MKTVIVGAGFSGLAVASRLRAKGVNPSDILIIEASSRIGGLISSIRKEGYLLEGGPEGFRGNSESIQSLLRQSGQEEFAIPSTPATSKRYIVRKGKLRKLPEGPLSAITTGVISFRSKLRILAEPFIKPSEIKEETLASFVSRRFGRGVNDVLDAFVSGVYAGDPNELVVDYVFPQLKEFERIHGSVVRGGMKFAKELKKAKKEKGEQKKKAREKPPFLYSFPNGLYQFIKATGEQFNIITNSRVEQISKTKEGYRVKTVSDEYDAETVVLAISPNALNKIQILGEKPKIGTREAKVIIVSLGYDMTQFARKPEGYGFLIPSSEDRFLLGSLYSSEIFPHHAPNNKILLRCFIGGIRHPEYMGFSDEEIVSRTLNDINNLLNPDGEPEFIHIHRNRVGIAQLETGHYHNLAYRQKIEKTHPGIKITGIGWAGISTNHLSSESEKVVNQLVSDLLPSTSH